MTAGKYIVEVNEQGQAITPPVPFTSQEGQIVYRDKVVYFGEDSPLMPYYIGGGVLGIIILWFIFLYPLWRVWASKKSGEADLQQAHKEQQIQVAKAQGRLDAATLNKEAAIVEAEAVSSQIEKIGKQLTEHDLYLKWQWIKMMEERPNSSVIYVPTETNLPILEATRLGLKKKDYKEEE